MTEQDNQRRGELVTALGAVRSRIADACIATGRDRRSVTMIAITKTYPAADVLTLAVLGVGDIGESRDQEASAKIAGFERLVASAGGQRPATPTWHFVGRLQSRKARSVAAYADVVHSLDRPELIDKLADGVDRAGRAPLRVFVQVSLDGDPERGGALPDAVLPLADAVAARPNLRLQGVMAVAPLGADPDEAFERLQAVSARLCAQHAEADGISAGMSSDMEQAIRHGATHVRVGTALLGRRTPIFG